MKAFLLKIFNKISDSRKYQSFILLELLSFILLLCKVGDATFMQWTTFSVTLFLAYIGGNIGHHHIDKKGNEVMDEIEEL